MNQIKNSTRIKCWREEEEKWGRDGEEGLGGGREKQACAMSCLLQQ